MRARHCGDRSGLLGVLGTGAAKRGRVGGGNFAAALGAGRVDRRQLLARRLLRLWERAPTQLAHRAGLPLDCFRDALSTPCVLCLLAAQPNR
ncbi:hypothetical protein ACFQ6O_43915 [Streptomyces sp. NPDC056441]|uniref:hypothetical protein n=1 Tax=Streptomyces sp. NPDC056441 TaxID=3345817 RepID=UPI003689F500